MGKGANYLNNNKGVFLQASKKKKAAPANSMPLCDYGAGCTNKACIYRHPTKPEQEKSPCMAFLAGVCAFDHKGCRKRHPPKSEREALIARYKRTPCRFGDACQTRACLYQHPSDCPEPTATGPVAWSPVVVAGPLYQMPPIHQAYVHQQQLYQRQQQQQHIPFPQQQQQQYSTIPPLAQAYPLQQQQQQQSQPNVHAAEFVPAGLPLYAAAASAPEFVPGRQWKQKNEG